MPQVTTRWAVGGPALLACVIYGNAVLNGWAGDDLAIILQNSRTHSIPSALAAWFSSYWPSPWEWKGLWRPLTILSYAVDWSLAGGTQWVFHVTNVVLHGLATGLAAAVALAWLPPVGALAVGLVFAVHPVHVEAVSNVVGRAELLAGCWLLASVLAARRHRHAVNPEVARRWHGLVVGCVGASLLSKEVGAVAVALLLLDQALDPEPSRRPTAGLHLSVVTVTLAWSFVWRSIAGPYVASAAAPAFYDMSRAERWSTMMPAQLEVVRLLAWPMDLASDYSPLTIPLRLSWTPLATLGLVVATSLLALALVVARRAPAVTFGILCGAICYAPTSNFLFSSGVVLAERALYLPVLAPALAVGWLVVRLEGRRPQPLLLAACGLVLAVFSARTMARTPFWRTPATPIVEEVGEHPENYRARMHLGVLLANRHDSPRALAEYLAAAALGVNDPFLPGVTIDAALSLRRYDLAIDQALGAYRAVPEDWRTGRWVTEVRLVAGRFGAAVAFARADAVLHPGSLERAQTYAAALRTAGAPRWRVLFAAASADWLSGDLVQASARLDSVPVALAPGALARVENASALCPDVEIGRPALRGLRPALLSVLPCASKAIAW